MDKSTRDLWPECMDSFDVQNADSCTGGSKLCRIGEIFGGRAAVEGNVSRCRGRSISVWTALD